ncbi:sensor histidine kinase [Paenibacillus thalictri]|uniref:histidine kinase n=1 Tax=Paenibacillus thalictri TaxID=2527873 RepID=A0A4Q9DJ33_9BACL|nr:sensor histidine kinase [Paenibacillus thalictri]TBL73939.1 sensor histidine kinase [Paenibacillus thalictri]
MNYSMMGKTDTMGANDMTRMTSLIMNLKLRNKLIVSFVLLIVLSTLSIGWISYLELKRAIVSEIGQSIRETLEQTMQNIDYKLRDIDDLYVKVIASKEMQAMLEATDVTPKISQAYMTNFYDAVYPVIFGGRSEQLQSVVIYGANGVNLSYNMPPAPNPSPSEVETTSVFRQAEAARGKSQWMFTNQNIFAGDKQGPKTISNVRKALALLTFKDWGLMMLNVRESYIYESYKNLISDMKAVTYIADPNGLIVSHADKSLLSTAVDPQIKALIMSQPKGSAIVRLEGTTYSVHFITSDYTGWKLVTMIPESSIYKNINMAGNTIMTIFAATVTLAVIFSVAISSGITLPLRKLLRHIKRVRDGNMDAKVHLGTQEEFGQLSESFNEMTEEIKALIAKVREDEKQIREAELRALQSQIKPHILYNTLDTIYWMTKTKEYDEIGEMTTVLAQFFRLSLNKGSETTTVAKEIEHAKHYLDIQKLQYKDKFDYGIEMDESVRDVPCIKLILQPIVENALLHGIRRMKYERGHVSIEARRSGEKIVLTIRDNGVGMDSGQIADILQQQRSDSAGYGAYNVQERLHLAYGKEYGIRYESEPGEGTVVQITIPGGHHV